MAVPTEFKTEKGTVLPMINLKGKPYLAVAHRLVWLTEKYSRYSVNTEFLEYGDEHAIVRANVVVYDDTGLTVRSASATKKETKKDFPDFLEKAETGALGRALAMLGLGTQFCTQDLDEGERLADAPVIPAKSSLKPDESAPSETQQVTKPKTTFSKPKQTKAEVTVSPKTEEAVDGWE